MCLYGATATARPNGSGGGGICLTLKHLHRRSKAWEGKAKRAYCSKSVTCMVDICLRYS